MTKARSNLDIIVPIYLGTNGRPEKSGAAESETGAAAMVPHPRSEFTARAAS
jgi:hypothetical protein